MSRFNADAEMSVVGGILIDNTALDRVSHIVKAEDFAIEACRLVYESASRLILGGLIADPITVAEDLDECNNLGRAGGLAYIGELYRETASVANVHRYAELVRDYSRERAMLIAINEAHDIIHQSGDSAQKIASATELVMGAAESHKRSAKITHAADLARKALSAINQRSEKGAEEGTSIGFADLERLTGPLKPGQMVVIAGRPAMGKSTLARNIAEFVAKTTGVLFVSLEMGDEELGECFIASLGKASFDAIKEGNTEGDHVIDMGRGASALANLKLAVATDTNTVAAIHGVARTEARKLGGIGLIVVDYLQLLEAPDEKDRRVQVDSISRGLKRLAMTMGVPLIALSQLSRKVEDRADKRPMLSDLRESGAIEQDADKVIGLYRDDYYHDNSPHKGMAEALVLKNRRGRTGSVPLAFIGDQSRFADAAPGYRFEQQQQQPKRRGFPG